MQAYKANHIHQYSAYKTTIDYGNYQLILNSLITTTNMLYFTLLLAMSTSLTLSQPQAPKGYAPGPEPHQPFTYQYGVADEYSNSNFRKAESQDQNVSHKNLFLNYHFFHYRVMSKVPS
jgi:hypothetical protein